MFCASRVVKGERAFSAERTATVARPCANQVMRVKLANEPTNLAVFAADEVIQKAAICRCHHPPFAIIEQMLIFGHCWVALLVTGQFEVPILFRCLNASVLLNEPITPFSIVPRRWL